MSVSSTNRTTADSRLGMSPPVKPSSLSMFGTDGLVGRLIGKKAQKKAFQRRFVRYGLIAGNVVLLLAVGIFVARSSGAGSGLQGAPAIANAESAGSDAAMANPLDRLSSADIALNVARVANLPEKTAVTNQADSENAQLSVSQSTGGLIAKTQVVSTELKSNKDIQMYVAVAGDTPSSIGAKFQVTADSVKWSNDLAGDTVTAGQTLYIPPAGLNGIVYVVKANDTPDTLAEKYRANKDRIIAYNDAEISGLKVGTRIIIPDGQIVRPVVVAAPSRTSMGSGFAWGGSSPIYNGSNGYDYGYCTWYVANRIAVPSNWGNANTWDNLAPRSGWVVSTAPRVGAIAQTDRGSEGHVAVVVEVSEDGTQIKYADMNGIAGWGREGFSGWTTAGRFEHYIYR